LPGSDAGLKIDCGLKAEKVTHRSVGTRWLSVNCFTPTEVTKPALPTITACNDQIRGSVV